MSSPRLLTRTEEQTLSLARGRLRGLDPVHIAERAGACYTLQSDGCGFFELACLNGTYRASHATGVVEAVNTSLPPKHAIHLLILHYLIHADGRPLAGRWIAFRELPDGLMYDRAVRARTEPPLLAAYGAHPERFLRAARALGGQALAFGDVAFGFAVLPRVHLAIILHRGDEEFPPAVRVLFDGAAGHYLPTDDLAVACGLLVGALLRETKTS